MGPLLELRFPILRNASFADHSGQRDEVVLLPPSNQRAANSLLSNIITNDLFNISCFIVDDEKFANILNEYGKSFQIILREGSVKGAMSFKEVCGKGRSSIADVSIEPSENCTPIIFPIIIDDKLMPLSFPNENIYKRGQEIGAKIGLNESDKMLIPFPLYLDCGVTASVVSALSHLAPMYIIPPCSPDVIADCIYAYGITCLNSNECWTKEIFSNNQRPPLDSWQKGIISASGYPDSGISNIGPNLAVGTGSHGIICCINGNFLPGIDQDVLGDNTSKGYCGKQKNLAKEKKSSNI